MKLYYKNAAITLMIVLILFMLFREFKPKDNTAFMVYSDFLEKVEDGKVIEVLINGDNISGLTGVGPFKTYVPADPEMISLLISKGVKVSAVPEKIFHGSVCSSHGFRYF